MDARQKFVVWDWNGTLLDDTDAVLVAVNAGLERIKCPALSMERFRAIQVRSLADFYLAAGVKEQDIATVLGYERSLFHDTYEPLADFAKLREGATDLLRRLHASGANNIILSNHLVDQIVRLLKNHDIHSYFSEILAYACRDTQFEDGNKGERLRHYIQANSLAMTGAVIVGDTMEEIDIARELGLCSVAITGGNQAEDRLRAHGPDYVVHSIGELGDVLRQRGFAA